MPFDADGSLYVATNLGVVHFGPDGRQLPQLSFCRWPITGYIERCPWQLWLAGSKGILLSVQPARPSSICLATIPMFPNATFIIVLAIVIRVGTLYFGTNGGFFFSILTRYAECRPRLADLFSLEQYEARQR